MTPQISGPRCDSHIKPDRYKSLVRESRVQQQISVIVKGNKIQLGFDNKYPENNQRVPRQRETWKKLSRWVVLFLMRRHNTVGMIMLKYVESRASYRLDFRRLPGPVFDPPLSGDECGLIFPNSGW